MVLEPRVVGTETISGEVDRFSTLGETKGGGDGSLLRGREELCSEGLSF